MRIKRGQHAIDRRFDQRGFIDLLNVIRADPLKHISKQIKLLVNAALLFLLLRQERGGKLGCQDDPSNRAP